VRAVDAPFDDLLGTREVELHDGTIFHLGDVRYRLVCGDDLERALLEDAYLETVTDSLTGVFNRAFLRAYERHVGPGTAVIAADLDMFKRTNDRYGHTFGDRLLVATTQRLRAHVRSPELVVRYGGEEFLVVLPGHSLDQARARAEAMRRTMEEPFPLVGTAPLVSTLSFGVTVVADEPDRLTAAIRRADDNLGRAKELGRNRVV
jgi:diguanylate cyclase (GGDEF)-like protein